MNNEHIYHVSLAVTSGGQTSFLERELKVNFRINGMDKVEMVRDYFAEDLKTRKITVLGLTLLRYPDAKKNTKKTSGYSIPTTIY